MITINCGSANLMAVTECIWASILGENGWLKFKLAVGKEKKISLTAFECDINSDSRQVGVRISEMVDFLGL